MSITGMRTKLGRNALLAIMVIGGLAIILPIFFSGAGSSPVRSPLDEEQQEHLKEQSQVVARVGAEEITRGDVNAVFERIASGQQITPMQRHESAPRVLESLQDQAILVSAARQQGLKVGNDEVRQEIDSRVEAESERMGVTRLEGSEKKRFETRIRSEVSARRNEIRDELLVQKMIDKLKQNVTLETEGLKPEEIEVNARHILIGWAGSQASDPNIKRTKAEAKALAEKLTKEAKANPAGFPALADTNTEDPSGKGQGGDLGWFTRERMVKPFSDAAFKAKSGEVTGPVESDFGYHVIKVEDRRVAEARAMQEVQTFIDNEKKNTKLEILASDFKAAQAYDEMMQNPEEDEKAKETRRKAVIEAYEAATVDRPRDGVLYARLGKLHQESGDDEKALAAYQQAAAQRNPSAETHLALGNLYRDQKQKEKALDHYKTAGRLAPNDMMIHLMLQMAYHDMGETELAEQQSERVRNAQQSQGGMFGMPGQPPVTIPGG